MDDGKDMDFLDSWKKDWARGYTENSNCLTAWFVSTEDFTTVRTDVDC